MQKEFVVRHGIIVGNNTLVVSNNKIGINTGSSSLSLQIASNDAILLPTGNTGQRPTVANGMIRYNSQTSKLEVLESGVWNSFTPTTVNVLAGGVATGGGALSANVTITVTAANSSQAQSGTSNTVVMTPWSTAQSISALGLSNVNIVTFTSSGTYTPNTQLKFCRIRVQAPGGGSGGSDGEFMAGAGGGGGEYAEGIFTAAQIGSSQSVTIGAAGTAGNTSGGNGGTGGTTSVGSLISCVGGGGGQGTGSNSTDDTPRTGGAGGTGGTGGHLRIPGGRGHSPAAVFNFATSSHFHAHLGHGGDAFMGKGAVIPNAVQYVGDSNQPAVAGGNYGGGASGGQSISNTGVAGALGGAGIVIIEEYL